MAILHGVDVCNPSRPVSNGFVDNGEMTTQQVSTPLVSNGSAGILGNSSRSTDNTVWLHISLVTGNIEEMNRKRRFRRCYSSNALHAVIAQEKSYMYEPPGFVEWRRRAVFGICII